MHELYADMAVRQWAQWAANASGILIYLVSKCTDEYFEKFIWMPEVPDLIK